MFFETRIWKKHFNLKLPNFSIFRTTLANYTMCSTHKNAPLSLTGVIIKWKKKSKKWKNRRKNGIIMENFGNFSSEKFKFNVGFKISKFSKIRINVIIFFCGKIFQKHHLFYNTVLYFFRMSPITRFLKTALIL